MKVTDVIVLPQSFVGIVNFNDNDFFKNYFVTFPDNVLNLYIKLSDLDQPNFTDDGLYTCMCYI